MVIDNNIRRMLIGGERVAAILQNGNVVYMNQDQHRAYLLGLRANPDGTGNVSFGGGVGWAKDLTGNGNHGVAPTATNEPILHSTERVIKFDGVDDYFSIAHSPTMDFTGKTAITVEGWFKAGGTSWGSYWSAVSRYNQFILGPNGAHAEAEMAFLVIPTGRSWEPLNYGSISWGQNDIVGFNRNEWHHYCGVADLVDKTTKLYVDGVLRITHPITGVDITNDIGPIHLCDREGDPVGTNHLNTFASDIRIWDTPRTAQQIADNFNRRLTGKEPGLMAYWPL